MSVFAAAVVFSAVQDDCPQKLAGLLHPISAMLDLVRTHFSLQLQAFLIGVHWITYWFAFQVITLVLFLQPSIDNSLSKRTKENLVEG